MLQQSQVAAELFSAAEDVIGLDPGGRRTEADGQVSELARDLPGLKARSPKQSTTARSAGQSRCSAISAPNSRRATVVLPLPDGPTTSPICQSPDNSGMSKKNRSITLSASGTSEHPGDLLHPERVEHRALDSDVEHVGVGGWGVGVRGRGPGVSGRLWTRSLGLPSACGFAPRIRPS